ncbi:ubiquinone biosynthesis protein UbiH [Corticibacter populi]|uniref:Ubiquinone biosynthesis protein UbiH n=1 Tax=Corticibacter populi TaxID=1550736 RepID=A0A3M6QTR8_9BURK|nr:FAD-dependent monooxygenase [Corticibacter populi]RMX06434.1 ubiquinone biosynthesis protein UbiH [Corticibacter populi]
MSSSDFDVCIRGAGIVGRALALQLARAKLRIALVDAPPAPPGGRGVREVRDVRAYALNQSSRQLLQALRCWPEGTAITPVRHMRVSGDAGGHIDFDAPPEAGDDESLAWIVDVPALEDMLAAALRFQPSVELVDEAVAAPLTAICEGRFSSSRAALRIDTQALPYPQHAVAARVRASEPHRGTASQWFTGPNIVALLPLGGPDGDEYALVWSTEPELARELLTLDAEAFAGRLEATIASAAASGNATAAATDAAVTPRTRLSLTAQPARWPLKLSQASRWSGPLDASQPQAGSWVLVGDAAHTVHPLAGSGLNLGLGDVAALSRELLNRPAWRPVNDRHLLRNYERERKSALWPYVAATDGLQWLFWQEQPWLQSLRNWGMNGFANSGPIKQWLARQAMRTG